MTSETSSNPSRPQVVLRIRAAGGSSASSRTRGPALLATHADRTASAMLMGEMVASGQAPVASVRRSVPRRPWGGNAGVLGLWLPRLLVVGSLVPLVGLSLMMGWQMAGPAAEALPSPTDASLTPVATVEAAIHPASSAKAALPQNAVPALLPLDSSPTPASSALSGERTPPTKNILKSSYVSPVPSMYNAGAPTITRVQLQTRATPTADPLPAPSPPRRVSHVVEKAPTIENRTTITPSGVSPGRIHIDGVFPIYDAEQAEP